MTDASAARLLVADIGGTFARFALARAGRLLTGVRTRKRNSALDLPSLCRQAADDLQAPLDGAAIAIAAPVSGGRARMTNAGWTVDEAGLAAALAVERVLLINDFAALACALPGLADADLLPIPPLPGRSGTAAAVPGGAALRVVFGPGTGLGVAALWRDDGRFVPIASEGGHAGFAPDTPFEQQVLARAAQRFGRVSWERILSGPGLELIDEVSREEAGEPGKRRPAAEIIAAAGAARSPAASRSLAAFAGLLGSFGGDLALTFRADGGVVIGGGSAARIAPLIALPEVRRRFCRKGRFSRWLGALPLAILRTPDAALRGAALAYGQRFPEDAGKPPRMG